MVETDFEIFWTEKAKQNLKEIYNYYKKKSIPAANNIKFDILQKPKSIVYAEQYQTDDYNPKYRRMIVRNYKLLYSCKGKTLYIHRIFDVRQNPGKI